MVLVWELAVRTALAFGTGTWVTEDDSVRQPSLRVSASRCVLALLPMIVAVGMVEAQTVDPATIEAGHPTGHLHDHGDLTWPPQPRGLTNTVPLSNPGSDALAADERQRRRQSRERIALLRADVREALGSRHSQAQLLESAAKAGAPASSRLVYFSHGNNITVEVALDGQRVRSVRKISPAEYQPDITDDEIAEGERLARAYFNDMGRERVAELQAYGILAYLPEGRGYYDTRVVYISFHRDGDAPPEFAAWVDLTRQKVLRARYEQP